MENTPARILIVDDEPSITEFVSYAMQKEGYLTEIASDGEEALRALPSYPYKNVYANFVSLCTRHRA